MILLSLFDHPCGQVGLNDRANQHGQFDMDLHGLLDCFYFECSLYIYLNRFNLPPFHRGSESFRILCSLSAPKLSLILKSLKKM